MSSEIEILRNQDDENNAFGNDLNKIQQDQAAVENVELEILNGLVVEENLSEDGIKKITVRNCSDKSNIFDFLELSDNSEVLLLKMKFIHQPPMLEHADLQEICIKCANKSIVLILESLNGENLLTVWKFRAFEHCWVLIITLEELLIDERIDLREFIAEFLTESLKKHHTGLMVEFNDQQRTKVVELDFLADIRNYNLLLLATERGKSNLVHILMKMKQNTISLNNTVDARELAWKHNHQDILLIFLRANMPFPSCFNITKCTGALKEFCDLTKTFSQLVIANNVERVNDILNQNEGINIFYNFQNESAAHVALASRSFETYELLLSRKFQFGLAEDPKTILSKLNKSDKLTVQKIHNDYSDHLADKHIHILMAKSHIFQDKRDGRDKRKIIQLAFETLNSNPFMQIILKIVATFMNLKLIFDFNRNTVDVVDPMADEHTQGLLYFTGKIYIGAKQLLNKETEDESMASLIHELCHFSMFLVYKNHAKPYKSNELRTEKDFEEIVQDCKKNQTVESLIAIIFSSNYTHDVQHAELIVRPVHLMVIYRKYPTKLLELRSIFQRLFEFYQTKVYRELEKALPEIEKRNKMETQKKDKIINKLKKFLWFGAFLGIIFIASGIYLTRLLHWTCHYDKLPESQKFLIENGTLKYANHEFQFQEVFPINSTAYYTLKSEHCSELYNEQSLDFGSKNYHYLYEHVSIVPKIIQDTISNASIIFGNETVQLNSLFTDGSLPYDKLSPANISEILKGNSLKFNDLSYLYGLVSVDSPVIRKTLCDAAVLYKNVEIHFCDLFPENSTIYSNLTSYTISQMLNRHPLEFSSNLLYYLDTKVRHSWGNLTTKLKDKFLNSNFIFQNETLKFDDMKNLTPNSFESLTSDQINYVLNNQSLKIHKTIQSKLEFYVERNFLNENIPEIYFDFMKYVNDGYDYRCWYFNKTKTTKTFEDFYSEFRSKNIDTQLEEISQIKQNKYYGDCLKNSKHTRWSIFDPETKDTVDSYNFHHQIMQMDFVAILEEAKLRRIFILSAEAGVGKTATFEHFTFKIKKQLPTFWVSYIDLKDHKKFYNSSGYDLDIQSLMEGILGLSSKNEFERRTFWELYKSGNAILLWNGFDEISPQYSDFILNALDVIKKNSTNIQFVSTRPLYKDKLGLKLKSLVYELLFFNDQQEEEFLTKLFISQNINDTKIKEFVEKVHKIVNSFSVQSFYTPLLLEMIGKLISNDPEIFISENLFDIYQTFIEVKVEIWQKKSEFGRKYLDSSITKYRKFDVMKLYQKYAIETMLIGKDRSNIEYKIIKKLKITMLSVPVELTNDEISRMAILYINEPENVNFAHETFQDFFIAQYLVDNIMLEKELISSEEAEARFDLFFLIIKKELRLKEKIMNFIAYFFKTKNSDYKLNEKFKELLRTKHKKVLFELVSFGTDTNGLNFFLTFLKNEHSLLLELLHVNESETIYTAAFNFIYHQPSMSFIKFDYVKLKNTLRPYLTEEDFTKIINGKNQKGVILFNLYCIFKYSELIIAHDVYSLDDKLLNCNDDVEAFKMIAMNLTKDELFELLMKKTSSAIYELKYVEILNKKEFWNFIESVLNKDERKRLTLEVLDRKIIKVSFEWKYSVTLDQLLRVDEYMSDSEIFEYFYTREVFLSIHVYPDLFNTFWSFFVKHANAEQQKLILSMRDEDDSLTSLQKMFTSLYINEDTIKSLSNIYEKFFTKYELQEQFSTPNDFFFKLFFVSLYNKSDLPFNYIKDLFLDNENSLKKLLEERNDKNMTVFEFFSNNKNSMPSYKLFHELYLSIQ